MGTTDLRTIVEERLAEKARQGRRPTQAEERWLELTAQRGESLSSVEGSRNAKGDMQFTVKVYHLDPDAAKAKAVELLKSLRATFPMGDGTVGSPMVEQETKGAQK